jgi:hypothetical protein
MFASSFSKPNEQKTGTLFGKTTAPFGASQQNTQQQSAPSLFGSTTAQTNTGGLGNTQQNAGSSLFGATQQQQQPQQQGFGGSMQQSQSGFNQSQAAPLPQLSKSKLMEFSQSVIEGQRKTPWCSGKRVQLTVHRRKVNNKSDEDTCR